MTDLVTRMRCQAEDLHVLNPASETVKCLSLGADELENALRRAEYWKAEHNAANAEIERLRDENSKLREALEVPCDD